MCVGKNSSQAASVEFLCSAQKLCAQQPAIPLAEKTKFFRQLKKSPLSPLRDKGEK
jgi:hypothetical protein